MAGALDKALEVRWQASVTRVIVHIADAPGHGDWVTPNSPARKQTEEQFNLLKCEFGVSKYLFIQTNSVNGLPEMVQAFQVRIPWAYEKKITIGLKK